MTENLVRWRELATRNPDARICRELADCADRVESLQAKVSELERERDALEKGKLFDRLATLNQQAADNFSDAVAWRDRAEAAESRIKEIERERDAALVSQDRLAVLEREHQEFYDRAIKVEATLESQEQAIIERCAKVCDQLDRDGIPFRGHLINVANADDCAAAIRSLKTGTDHIEDVRAMVETCTSAGTAQANGSTLRADATAGNPVHTAAPAVSEQKEGK